MELTLPTKWVVPGLALAVTLAVTAGCGRSDNVTVQRVPKDDSAPLNLQSVHAGMDAGSMGFHGQMGAPATPEQVKWVLPAGWEEKPLSQMRVGSFNARTKDGQTADVSIIPLPAGEREVDFVNMWRQQMQLPAASESEAAQQAQPVAIGPESGRLYELASVQTIPELNGRGRMLVAVITRSGMSWFFKMTGTDSTVAEAKPAFLQFLKSVSFVAPATAPQMTMTATPDAGTVSAAADAPATWTVPSGWQQQPPTAFLLAKYEVTSPEGAKADVNVSVASGGVLANVNRWRGQLSLPPVTEADLPSQTSSLDTGSGSATIVDMTGTDHGGQKSRLIGAILPQGNQTWFYKLMGDEKIVGQQKDNFVKFIQSAKYTHVH